VAHIPLATSQRVGQDQVGLLDREEARRIATSVRVVPLGERTVGSPDLVVGGVPRHAQRRIGIGDPLHAAHPHSLLIV
jgi:hypothetical protein